MTNTFRFAFGILFLIGNIMYADPIKIAKANRALWTYPMRTEDDFDIASKCEMLVFVEVFNQYSSLDAEVLSQKLGLKNINHTAVKKWEEQTKKTILLNFKNLNKNTLSEVISINNSISWDNITTDVSNKKIPTNLKPWYQYAVAFYEAYLYEQYRLAALFPRITSEINTLAENEVTGHELDQKHFLLTFDDGPTAPYGNTDKLLKVLNDYQLKAFFFVLGDSFQNRLNTTSKQAIATLYQGQIVASHGKEHVSHQKYQAWQNSIDYTNTVIQKSITTTPSMVAFRPPYGQRNKTLSDYLNTQKAKVILWNIDSQDWNKDINATEVADRQITLMLLWRKGILLFHDVHSKAQTAVPIIYNYFKDTKIVWDKTLSVK